jgi:hypothetical protein
MWVNDRYITAATVEVCSTGMVLLAWVRAHTTRSDALAAALHAATTLFAAICQLRLLHTMRLVSANSY